MLFYFNIWVSLRLQRAEKYRAENQRSVLLPPSGQIRDAPEEEVLFIYDEIKCYLIIVCMDSYYHCVGILYIMTNFILIQ